MYLDHWGTVFEQKYFVSLLCFFTFLDYMAPDVVSYFRAIALKIDELYFLLHHVCPKLV